MRLKSALMGIAVTLAFAVFSPTIARADLLGSDVTAVLFYPNETTFCNVGPADCSPVPIGPIPVTSGVPPEFPAGTLVFDGSLAVSGSQIIWTATLPEIYATGTASGKVTAFNGFALQFTGAPAITDVTLDPDSTILPVPFPTGFPAASSSGISFNAENVMFNVAGDSVSASQQLILDVQTVPEPASVVLLGIGLVGGVVFLRRKFEQV
jgi:hypothetical protein